MKKILIFALIAASMSAFAFKNNGNKDLKTKEIKISEFSSVSVSSGIDVIITPGNSNIATVETSEKYLENVVVENKGNDLVIKFDKRISIVRGPIRVYIKANNLEGVNASGGSDVICEEELTCQALSIKASGGSDIKMRVKANKIDVSSSGGADVILSGTAVDCSINCSGGSDMISKKLITENCTVNISGGSDAIVHATKSLTVEASGGSDLIYSGNPAIKNIHACSSSDVCKAK